MHHGLGSSTEQEDPGPGTRERGGSELQGDSGSATRSSSSSGGDKKEGTKQVIVD
jgi:hypothetical protein